MCVLRGGWNQVARRVCFANMVSFNFPNVSGQLSYTSVIDIWWMVENFPETASRSATSTPTRYNGQVGVQPSSADQPQSRAACAMALM